MIWANLIHLSFNMWGDRELTDAEIFPVASVRKHLPAQPYLRFDEDLWNLILERMSEAGMNMVVLDLGDAVQYKSHPEVAIKNAWSVSKLKSEIKKMRAMGLEPIPKLNFSCSHDAWLGDYARMISTPTYYKVVKDLIEEVIQIFDTPRFFHIGMDEEAYENQKFLAYAAVRQHELWWHDLNFYVSEIKKHNVRAWMWGDTIRYMDPETFYQKMDKTVLQSNWSYGKTFRKALRGRVPKWNWEMVQSFNKLEKGGYEQIPTASNWIYNNNLKDMVAYCQNNLSPSRLKGFMMTTWLPTVNEFRDNHLKAIQITENVISSVKKYAPRSKIN
jgi:hypothetical protein